MDRLASLADHYALEREIEIAARLTYFTSVPPPAVVTSHWIVRV